MLFDRLIHQWLRHRRIVHFAMAMPPVANQIHDDIGAELITVFSSQARDSQHRVNVFTIHVENRNRLPPSQLRGETRRMFFPGIRGEADQVINDHMNRPAHRVAAQIRIVQASPP